MRTKQRYLVVGDNPVSIAVSQAELLVTDAVSVEQAMMLPLKSAYFGYLICLAQIPNEKIFQLIGLLKSNQPLIPVIAISELQSEATIVRLMKAGLDDYVPLQNLGQLPAVINSACEMLSRELNVNDIQAILATAELFESIATKHPGAYYQLVLTPDRQYQIPFASADWQKLIRVNAADVKNDATRLFAAIHEKDLSMFAQLLNQSAGNLSDWVFEFRLNQDNSEDVWLRNVAKPYQRSDGAVVWNGVLTDISERKWNESRLTKEKEFSDAIVDTVDALVVVLDKAGVILRFNRACEQVSGYLAIEVVGKPVWSLAPTTEINQAKSHFASLMAGSFPNSYEGHWLARQGSELTIRWSTTCMLDDKGEIKNVIGTGVDITEKKRLQFALNASETFNKLLFEQSPIGLVLSSMDGSLLEVNPAYAHILGRTVEETRQLTYWQITPEKYAEQEREQLEKLQAVGRYGPYEKEYIHKDGHLVDVRLNGLIVERQGQQYIWSSVEDISKEAQIKQQLALYQTNLEVQVARRSAELQASEIRQRTTMNTVVDVIISIGESGIIETANTAVEKVFGYKPSELIGKNVKLLMPEPYQHEHDQYLKNYRLTGEARILGIGREMQGLRKNGEVFPLDLAIGEMTLDGQRKFVGVIRDISQRKAVEQQLIDNQTRLDFLVNAGPAVIYTSIIEGDKWRPEFVSANLESIFGYSTLDYFSDENFWSQRLHPDDKLSVMKNRVNIIKQGIFSSEYRWRLPDGSYQWIHDESRLVLNDDGSARVVIGYWSDIQKQKEVEKQIQVNEERFRHSQIFANIGTWDWTIPTGELYWSDRIGPLFGYAEGTLDTTYENFLAAVHTDDRQAVINAVSACVEQGVEYNIEHRCVWPDGTVRWLLEKGDVSRDSNGKPLHMLGVVQDITQRKQLEIRLAQQREIQEMVRRGLTQFIASTNIREVTEFLLTGLLKITGSDQGFVCEVLLDDMGQPYLQTHAKKNIEWVESIQKSVMQGLEEHNLDNLLGEVIKTGEIVISNAPHTDPRSGSMSSAPNVFTTFLGVPVYYGKTLMGMYALANRPEGYDETFVELLEPFSATYGVIVQTKRAFEREADTMKALVSAKEEAVVANQAKSDFLSQMSHELRTPMNAILGFTQLLLLEDALSLNQQEYVHEIKSAGEHLLELINEVLDLARIESGSIQISLQAVALQSVLQECYALMKPMADANRIDLQIDVDRCCYHVQSDYIRIKQVVLNLLSNALKYNRPGGSIRLHCEKSGNNVLLHVSDTGMGIAPEKLNDLFKPFNRLGMESSAIQGAGIGLVITRHLIELMGGKISVVSQPRQGSTFTIEMPISDEVPADMENMQVSDSTATAEHLNVNMKTVLYVEDNPANLKLVQQILRQLPGVKLVSAHTGDLGLAMATTYLPDLILLDINLPGLSGYEIVQRLKQIDKTQSIPTIALSANAMPKEIQRGLAAGFDAYLTKPINVNQLLECLNSFLFND